MRPKLAATLLKWGSVVKLAVGMCSGQVVASKENHEFVAFRDVTLAKGITFVHSVAADDEIAMGAGGAMEDFNGDGWPDLFLAQRIGANALYMNLGAGNGFVDVAALVGVDDPLGEGTGGLWGDYDNDGDQDLYVMNRGANILYRNDGPFGMSGWTFTDVTAAAGVAGFGRTSSAVYGDYDNDGYLDLYVANHTYPKVKPSPGQAFHSDVLYHNVSGPGGTRVFQDVTAATLDPARLAVSVTHSAGFFDYDGDGDMDLYVVNEDFSAADAALTGENFLWRNDGPDGMGGWLFVDVAATLGVAWRHHPMGLAIGDPNHDGLWDFALSDVGSNTLWRNTGGGFTEEGAAAGVARPVVPDGNNQISWGLVFLDYDLDGHEDLYVSAGALDILNWVQPNPLFRNRSGGKFALLEERSGAFLYNSSRTVVRGDYDRDGDEDLLVCNMGDRPYLYRNEKVGGTFLALTLQGTASNRDGIGARVKVSAAGLPDQYRLAQSGSTTGGSHDHALVFGLAGRGTADLVTVSWPSGNQTVLSAVPANQFLTVVE